MVTKKSTSSSKKDEVKKNSSKKTTQKKERIKDPRKEAKESLDVKHIKGILKETFVSNYFDVDSIPDDILCKHFLDFAEKYDSSDFKDSDEYGQYFCKYLMIKLKDSIDELYPFENSLLEVMNNKEKESKFGNVLKAFDYLGRIIVIRAIIIVFKGYSIAGTGWRVVMGLYLIWWIISVIRSVIKNTDVVKNTNKLMRTIINSRRMLHRGEDIEDVEDELNLQKILKKN